MTVDAALTVHDQDLHDTQTGQMLPSVPFTKILIYDLN